MGKLQAKKEAKYIVMDLEADGLLYDATKVHCMVLRYQDNTTNGVY